MILSNSAPNSSSLFSDFCRSCGDQISMVSSIPMSCKSYPMPAARWRRFEIRKRPLPSSVTTSASDTN